MLTDQLPGELVIPETGRSEEVLKEAAKALLTCIPPCRPIDIVTREMLRDELAHPVIDYLAVAQVSASPSVSVDTIDVNELIALLNGVSIPDLPNMDVHDKTSVSARIASKLKGGSGGHANANLGGVPKREMHNGMASAACSDEESVKSCTSVQSASGHISGMTRQIVLKCTKRERKGSRLRVDRQSIGGGKVGAVIDCLLNQQELSSQQVLVLKEAIDSGNMLEHVEAAFTLMQTDFFADKPGSVELVLTFCLNVLAVFVETRSTPIMPFDVNKFMLKVLPVFVETVAVFELKHMITALCCLVSGKVFDESIMSAYFMACLDMLKSTNTTGKVVFPQLKNLLAVNFAHQSDKMKEGSIINLLEHFSTSTESVKLVIELTMECLTSIGGKEQLGTLVSLCKIVSDYLWNRIIDQRVVGEKKEFSHSMLSEIGSLSTKADYYPCFIICQSLVPICIKSLGKESSMDTLIKCRLIDFVGKVVVSMNSEFSDDFANDKTALWLDLYESWSENKSDYSLVIQESVLYRNKDKMLAFLASLCSADAVTIRLKAIRAVVSAGKTCPDVVINCLESKLSDPSPAARDCILDALLKEFSSTLLSDNIIKQDACYSTLRDEWFIKSLNSQELLISTIMDLSDSLVDPSTLNRFIERLLSDPSIEAHHSSIVEFLNTSVDKLIDRVLDVGGSEDSQSVYNLLSAINIFSQSTPKLLEPHLEILKHFAESKNHKTVEAALSLFAQCTPHVSLTCVKSLNGYTELLTRSILTGTENTVRYAIDCLYIYCSRVLGSFDLILKLWSKFSKYLKSKLDDPSGSTAAHSRALFSLGCLCRHSGRATEDSSSDIPGHLLSAVQLFIKWYYCNGFESSVKTYAVQAAVQSIESFPSLLLDPLVFEFVGKCSNRADHLAVILKCLSVCLTITNQQVNSDISFDPSAANRQSVNPLTSSIIQSPSESVRMEAEKALNYLVDKHPSFITAQLGRTIQMCFNLCYQQTWTNTVDIDNEEVVQGPLTMFYEKCADLKKKGSDFVSQIVRFIGGTKDLVFLSWIVQSTSLLRLRQSSEVSCLLKGLSQETALIADSVIEEGAVDAIERHQLIKFILLSAFHNHLKRVYPGIRDGEVNPKTTLKQKPKLFTHPSEWIAVTQEQAYEEVMRIIQEDTIRVSLEDLEDSDELSMKSPPIINATKRNNKSKGTRRPLKVNKTKAAPKRTVVVPVVDSPGSQRMSVRSSSQSRINYFESSDDE